MVNHESTSANDARPAKGPAIEPCLGVLFVHGAGDHGTGSTLIEFGEPLIAWLDGWLRHGRASPDIAGDRALTGVAQILVREGDQHAPAHSYVRLRPEGDANEHTWLLAEAHWDQAFTPPAFQQVLLWALGVVPWTVLTQFIGPLARRAQFVQPTPLGVAGYLWRVFVAAATALIASAIVFALATLILILSLIPIDSVRNIVGSLQRFASGGVGDLYMVLTSSVQRAALSSAVQRDIDWLRQQGCDRIAMIAHSQGGYVAYQALAEPWPGKVELFITFGSGLIRLTESERARRTPALLLALIGTIGAILAIRFLPSALLGEAGIWDKHQANGLAFTVGAVLGGLLVVVLWRYFHDKSEVADLPTPIPWFDFLTTEDPVMNRRREGHLPAGVQIRRTQNRGSRLGDHSSYWQNTDEFVPQVAMAVSTLDPNLDLMLAGPKPTSVATAKLLHDGFELRHGRVSALRLRGSAVVAATIAVIALLLLRPGELDTIGRRVGTWLQGLPGFLTDWIPDVVRSVLPIDGIETIVLGGAVVVLLSGIASFIGTRIWNAWSTGATLEQFRGQDRKAVPAGHPVRPSARGISFYGWTLLHLATLAVVVILGPKAILDAMGGIAGERDAIAQAWARQFTWTLAIGAIGWFWASSPVRIAHEARARIVLGVILAFAIELVIAIAFPGPMQAPTSIPFGLGIGIISIGIAWIAWPGLRWAFDHLAALVEVDREPEGILEHPASIIDYLGFIGLLLGLLAATLLFIVPASAIHNPMHLARVAAILAFGSLAFGLVLAVNSEGIMLRTGNRLAGWLSRVPGLRAGWDALARNTTKGSVVLMRAIGFLAFVLGIWTLVVAVGRVISLGGPID